MRVGLDSAYSFSSQHVCPSNTTAPSTMTSTGTVPHDWTQAKAKELWIDTDDKEEVSMAKLGEKKHRKKVKAEVEQRVREEEERRVEAKHKAREEAKHIRLEAE